VHGDVERRQAHAQDAFHVLVAHVAQGYEVAIQERQSVVVIVEQSRRPGIRRHLVHEAEDAVVVALHETIEQR